MSDYDDLEVARLRAISATDRRREQMQAGQPTQPNMRGLPQIQDVVWPKERPQYRVSVWLWRDGDGRFECSAFDVSRVPGARAISSTTLRDLPVRELIDEAIERYLAHQVELADMALAEEVRGPLVQYDAATDEQSEAPVDDEFLAARRAYWQEARDVARQRLEQVRSTGKRRSYDDAHFEEVARIYYEAQRDGRPKQTAIAEALGLSRSAAGNHIATAKDKGFISTDDEGRN